MEDAQIILLLEQREESAVQALSDKYGGYCSKIAWNLLRNKEDTEECVNDTWFCVWRYVPPKRPRVLSAFCGKIVKGLAIDCLRKKCAGKRTDSHMVSLGRETEGLDAAVADFTDDLIRQEELLQVIHGFLDGLDAVQRDIFIRRYWYLDPIHEIAKRHGKRTGSVKTSLYRMRRKLQGLLEERGIL